MSPNRIVALITPICALAAGWAATWLADNVPGLNVSQENLQAVFVAGAVAVLTPAAQWLYGWQKYEARQAELERLAVLADAAAAGTDEDADLDDLELPVDEFESGDLDEIEDLEELEDELAAEDAERVSP
jgi:hypothetical protein